MTEWGEEKIKYKILKITFRNTFYNVHIKHNIEFFNILLKIK